MYSPYRKGTVLAPVGGTDHLHVICNDPAYYAINGCDCILAVNISTIYAPPAHHDPACILRRGDHPFVNHDSYVYYADDIIWKVTNVISRQQSGELTQHADMNEEIFLKVHQGFEVSDFTPYKVLKFLRQHC